MPRNFRSSSVSSKKAPPDDRKQLIAYHFQQIMETLGLDMADASLKGTPERVAKMYVDEIFYGLDEKKFPRVMTIPNDGTVKYNQILLEKNIKVMSVCEHHILPIVGYAHVAYIPKDKVIGLSKLNRIVDFFSRKPQVQERLTEEIHARFCKELETEDVAVIIDAKHYCVILRGIQDMNSSTVTSKLSGAFKSDATRKELMDLIHLPQL